MKEERINFDKDFAKINFEVAFVWNIYLLCHVHGKGYLSLSIYNFLLYFILGIMSLSK
jgi:hypothetical protein